MTGSTIAAEEMFERGIINHIYTKGEFHEKVLEFATQLTSKPTDRLQVIKQLTQISVGSVDNEALNMENEALSNFYLSDKGQAKIQEFYQNSLNKKQ